WERERFGERQVKVITHTHTLQAIVQCYHLSFCSQKYLLSNPAHQSSAVAETFLLNESASQVREISKFKPLSSRTSVSVIIGDSFDEQIPAPLNQVVAQLQKTLLEQTYPSANQIHVKGGDRRMIYKRPSVVRKHLWKLVSQRQSKQQIQ
uniref:Uncharacterized protein n=1 Tax=Hucho hucho TaxID=62062 RepID=A0A4W5QE79_9TELE